MLNVTVYFGDTHPYDREPEISVADFCVYRNEENDFVIEDACGRGVPINSEAIPELIEALKILQKLSDE